MDWPDYLIVPLTISISVVASVSATRKPTAIKAIINVSIIAPSSSILLEHYTDWSALRLYVVATGDGCTYGGPGDLIAIDRGDLTAQPVGLEIEVNYPYSIRILMWRGTCRLFEYRYSSLLYPF
jgi:hypothetical protein